MRHVWADSSCGERSSVVPMKNSDFVEFELEVDELDASSTCLKNRKI